MFGDVFLQNLEEEKLKPRSLEMFWRNSTSSINCQWLRKALRTGKWSIFYHSPFANRDIPDQI
jgi:hypothetical protein